MTRGWNGYLVRALREFASLTAERGATNASYQIAIRAKHQRSKNKASGIRRRQKNNPK
jgi:hypothetical protein